MGFMGAQRDVILVVTATPLLLQESTSCQAKITIAVGP